MKKLAPLLALLFIVGCTTTQQTTAYKTLAATEAAVTAANSGYYDSVVTAYQAGNFAATNSVPTVSAAYNDVQLAIHTAAVVASSGLNATPPAVVQAKANNFINLTVANKPH